MLLDRDDVKFVKSSSNGKDYGVHVVVIVSEPSLETSSTKPNSEQEWKLILKWKDRLKR
jgi:hypothetical protein